MKSAVRWVLAGLTLMLALGWTLVPASAKGDTYMTGFIDWRASDKDFSRWDLSGVILNAGGELVFDPASAVSEADPYSAGSYYGGNFYTGGSYFVGEAVSPEMTASINFTELIASWNADTPVGSWVEIQARAQLGTRWTKWYNLGIWASTDDTIQRHSVRLQGDADGYVAVDTLVISAKKMAASGFQIKVRLFSVNKTEIASVRYISAAYSTAPVKKSTTSTGDTANWGDDPLAVPECSQMVYPEGGNVWCSPTSVTMVLLYWGVGTAPCAAQEYKTVEGVYDWIYDGHGNWPFNTAYAATYGLEASVRRFTSLDEVEYWVSKGVPVVFSFAWKKSDLTGAAVSSSSGHLSVIVGFDSQGNPIVNDPAAATDEEVQRTYLRSELESVWLESSGGTVYLIYPPSLSE